MLEEKATLSQCLPEHNNTVTHITVSMVHK